MRNANNRLNNIEEALTPSSRTALVFVRDGYKEEDKKKQIDEFKKLHGERGSVTFLILTDWGNDQKDYENFISSMRKQSERGNCYAWW